MVQSGIQRHLGKLGGRTANLPHADFHADSVDPYTVFNIKGNSYRLIVKIEYRWQIIFVKHLLTHEEYDKGGWKK